MLNLAHSRELDRKRAKLKKAIAAVTTGKLTRSESAQKFGVAKTTLQKHLSDPSTGYVHTGRRKSLSDSAAKIVSDEASKAQDEGACMSYATVKSAFGKLASVQGGAGFKVTYFLMSVSVYFIFCRMVYHRIHT